VISGGERERLRALYPALRRFAGVVAPAGVAADDLVQDAFTRLIARGGLDGIDDPSAYLRRAIVNLASNERRHSRAAQRALVRHGAGPEGDRPVYPSDLAQLLRLDVRSRVLLFAVEVEGASIAEAAALAGCTEGAARMTLSRARRKLRSLLEDDDAHTA